MIEWRPLPSNPKYLISSDGQVQFIGSARPRKAYRGERRYCYIGLLIDGKRYCRTLHSLVAETFIGPRPAGMQLRHLDGDSGNNRADNLAYGSAKENAADRETHGRTARGQRGGNARLPDDEVDMLRLGYMARLFDQRQLAAIFNISQAQVNNIVLNKQRVRAA